MRVNTAFATAIARLPTAFLNHQPATVCSPHSAGRAPAGGQRLAQEDEVADMGQGDSISSS